MSKTNTLLVLLFTTFIVSLSSCEKATNIAEENEKTAAPTFLTLNGETKEIINNGEVGLRITKEVIDGEFSNLIGDDERGILLTIDDPNRAILANWGDYNFNSSFGVLFYLKGEIRTGVFTSSGIGLETNANGGSLLIGGDLNFSFLIESYSFEIKENEQKWIIEFNDVRYKKILSESEIEIPLSGRITLNK